MHLIALRRNPNGLSSPTKPCRVWALPTPPIPWGTTFSLFHPTSWSPLRVYNTSSPFHLGTTASDWNALPSFPMAGSLKVFGEAFTDLSHLNNFPHPTVNVITTFISFLALNTSKIFFSFICLVIDEFAYWAVNSMRTESVSTSLPCPPGLSTGPAT